jgi:hypothetical protein
VKDTIGKDTLRAVAKKFDPILQSLRELQDDDNDDAVSSLIEQLFAAPTADSNFKQIRKALGRERFLEIMPMMLEMAAGNFLDLSARPELDDPDRLERAKSLDVALGLKRARTDYFERGAPIISGDYSDVFRSLSESLGERTLVELLDETPAEELDAARHEYIHLAAIVTALHAWLMMTTGDSNALGLKRAGAMLADPPQDVEALLVLGWCAARREPTIRSGAYAVLRAVHDLLLKSESTPQSVDLEERRSLRHTKNVFPYGAPRPKS